MPKLIYHDSDGMDKVLMLGSEPILIGRATECQVQTQDAMVSRRHARIYWDGNYWIEDLGSSNGVYVGNDKVQKAPFRPGDTVTCGSLVLRLMPDTSPRHDRQHGADATGPQPPQPPPPPRAATPPVGIRRVRRSAAADGAAAAAAPMPSPSLARPSPPPHAPRCRWDRTRFCVAPSLHRTPSPVRSRASVKSCVSSARSATRPSAPSKQATKEAALLKRKLDQAQADLKRMRSNEEPPAAPDDAELQLLHGRVAELEDQLRRARAGNGGGSPAMGVRSSADPAAADAAIALGDSLAELRASLRAANDEAGLLKTPVESVEVVGEALRSAAEQLEAARSHLRALAKLLGVT